MRNHGCVASTGLSLAQRRYLELLRQVLAEHGGPTKHGARAAAGRVLGISGSHVTQLLAGDKEPGQDIIDRTIERRIVSGAFFHDRELRGDYHAYDPRRRRVDASEETIPAAWLEMEADGTIEGYRRAGVREEQLDAIRDIPGMRGGITRGELITHLDAAAANAAKMQANEREPEEAAHARAVTEADLAHRMPKGRRQRQS